MLQFYTDNELVDKIIEGDKVAFGVVFNKFNNKLYCFAYHYLNNKETAKDVVQDVFSNVWECHEDLQKVRNISSWLYTMTKNQCLKKIDHLKVKQKHTDHLRVRELDITRSVLEDLNTSPLIFEEINNIIENTLKKLSPQSRRIFLLSKFENKKNREIAAELNISIKTVEANISKVLKVFRCTLKDYLPFITFLFI